MAGASGTGLGLEGKVDSGKVQGDSLRGSREQMESKGWGQMDPRNPPVDTRRV